MATVDQGLQSQLRNIETTYGKTIDEWVALLEASRLRRHGQIVAMLKADYGLARGAANRVALVALDRLSPAAPLSDPIDALYAGRPTSIRAIHDRIIEVIDRLGGTFEISPKKGYLSLRRRVQFGMLKPAAAHLDVALVLRGVSVTDRLESAANFNALFTHRVRIRTVDEVDTEFIDWIRNAYDAAG